MSAETNLYSYKTPKCMIHPSEYPGLPDPIVEETYEISGFQPYDNEAIVHSLFTGIQVVAVHKPVSQTRQGDGSMLVVVRCDPSSKYFQRVCRHITNIGYTMTRVDDDQATPTKVGTKESTSRFNSPKESNTNRDSAEEQRILQEEYWVSRLKSKLKNSSRNSTPAQSPWQSPLRKQPKSAQYSPDKRRIPYNAESIHLVDTSPQSVTLHYTTMTQPTVESIFETSDQQMYEENKAIHTLDHLEAPRFPFYSSSDPEHITQWKTVDTVSTDNDIDLPFLAAQPRAPQSHYRTAEEPKVASLAEPITQLTTEGFGSAQIEISLPQIAPQLSAPSSNDMRGEDPKIASIDKPITQKASNGSIFMRIPPNLFQYELLPYFETPKSLSVLRCVNRQHYSLIEKHKEGIITHFEENVAQQIESNKENIERYDKAENDFYQIACSIKRGLSEIGGIMNPSPVHLQVTNIVVMLLTGKPQRTWEDFRKLVYSNFFKRLVHFNETKDSVPPARVQKCIKAYQKLDLTEQDIRKQSVPAAYLYSWYTSLLVLYYPIVRPLRNMQQTLNRQLEFLKNPKVSIKVVELPREMELIEKLTNVKEAQAASNEAQMAAEDVQERATERSTLEEERKAKDAQNTHTQDEIPEEESNAEETQYSYETQLSETSQDQTPAPEDQLAEEDSKEQEVEAPPEITVKEANTIQNLRRVLLWEIFAYDPQLFFVLECCSKKLRNGLNSDMTYIQYFLEQNFSKSDVRDKTMKSARHILYQCLNNEGQYLAIINDPAIWVYDPVKKEERVYQHVFSDMPYSKDGFGGDSNITFIPKNSLFTCGDTQYAGCGFVGSGETYIYNFSTGQLEEKPQMKYARGGHALIKIGKKIFVFGGRTMGGCIKQCEAYSIYSNTWTRIADLLHYIDNGFAAIHKRNVYLVGKDAKLQIYNPRQNSFSLSPIRLTIGNKFIVSHSSTLFIFTSGKNLMTITEKETKTQQRKNKFGHVLGHVVCSGDMVYLMDGTCLAFSCVTGKITKTKLKAQVESKYEEED